MHALTPLTITGVLIMHTQNQDIVEIVQRLSMAVLEQTIVLLNVLPIAYQLDPNTYYDQQTQASAKALVTSILQGINKVVALIQAL